MSTTTLQGLQPTVSLSDAEPHDPPVELCQRYDDILDGKNFAWTSHFHLIRQLGKGGQGVVFLSEQRGAEGFTLPIAIKVFSPAPFMDARGYNMAMARMAHVAARVAQVQHDKLLYVHNLYDRNNIRLMVMEWVDGYDLRTLLNNELLELMRGRLSSSLWQRINEVIITNGDSQPRIKAGVAISIVRDALSALGALHRNGIIHGDIKPGNIMLKRTGNVKIVDIGSAFELEDPPASRSCTPRYAAPEVLDGQPSTPRSDLASLGYVLVELLSGKPVFEGQQTCQELMEAKRLISQNLEDILPYEVACNELLMKFIQRLIAPDPSRRFSSAEVADYFQDGAVAFQRQLIQGDLATEYDVEIRSWIEAIHEIEENQELPRR